MHPAPGAPGAGCNPFGQAPAVSSARRTITQARWRLYSVEPSRPASGLMPSLACAAASAADAPEASAASTPLARTAVGPAPHRPDAPAATALRDRSADDRPVLGAPAELGVRALRLAAGDADLGRSARPRRGPSCSSRRRSSSAAIVRVPDALWTTISAPSASTTAGRSPCGSACASEPPIVPRLRTCWSPMPTAAAARAAALAATSALSATAR